MDRVIYLIQLMDLFIQLTNLYPDVNEICNVLLKVKRGGGGASTK